MPVLTPAPLLLVLALLLSACASAPAQRSAELAGRTYVVTGASSGFGRGVAVELGGRGANVVLAARRADLLEQAAQEARAAGGRALVVPTDVGREADMARLADATVREFGRIDVWINNARVGALGRFDEVPVADHARIVDVNLKGVIYGSHHALRQFRRQGGGVLVNIGSVVSRVPMPYYASYVATKHGVLGLGAALNQELKAAGDRNIKVVTVMPFAADTPWFDHAANYSGRSPRMILMDDPAKVVDGVIRASQRPRPEYAVGWKAKSALVAHRLAPRLTESAVAAVVHDVQMRDAPAGVPPGPRSIHEPMPEGAGVEGGVGARMAEEDRRKTEAGAPAADPRP